MTNDQIYRLSTVDSQLSNNSYAFGVLQFLFDLCNSVAGYELHGKWVSFSAICHIIHKSSHFAKNKPLVSHSPSSIMITPPPSKRPRKSPASTPSSSSSELSDIQYPVLRLEEIAALLNKIIMNHTTHFGSYEEISDMYPTLLIRNVDCQDLVAKNFVGRTQEHIEMNYVYMEGEFDITYDEYGQFYHISWPPDQDKVTFFRFNGYRDMLPIHEMANVGPLIVCQRAEPNSNTDGGDMHSKSSGKAPSISSRLTKTMVGKQKCGNLRYLNLESDGILHTELLKSGESEGYAKYIVTKFKNFITVIISLFQLKPSYYYSVDTICATLKAMAGREKLMGKKINAGTYLVKLFEFSYKNLTEYTGVTACETCIAKLTRNGLYFSDDGKRMVIYQREMYGEYPNLRFYQYHQSQAFIEPLSIDEEMVNVESPSVLGPASVVYPTANGIHSNILAAVYDRGKIIEIVSRQTFLMSKRTQKSQTWLPVSINEHNLLISSSSLGNGANKRKRND